MSLTQIASQNTVIVNEGSYVGPAGERVDIASSVAIAKAGTQLWPAAKLEKILASDESQPNVGPPDVRVVRCKTGEAARLLAAAVGETPVALNFASAKNPGGGYLRGSKAQEEDLARCSALYYAQLTVGSFYDINRKHKDPIYTDAMIYSPAVPFFRDEDYELLARPVEVAIITAPAPNAGVVLQRDGTAGPRIDEALRRRIGMVLALASAKGHRHLVLGAWGCGVFRNDPTRVAGHFAQWLASPRFAGAFDTVVFAVYERKENGPNLAAFRREFA